MRKIYFIALLVTAFNYMGAGSAKAQSLDDSLRHYLRNLSVACCAQNAPFLYDMAVHVTDTVFYTPLSYDTSDMENYLNLYNEMFYSAYDTFAQPNFLQWYGLSQRMANDDTIPIGIFDFLYNKFKNGVFDSINNFAINPGDTNAWFGWNNDSIYNGRTPLLPWSDAYKINPATHNRLWEIFASSPLSSTANFRNVIYSIDPRFVFANPTGLLPGGTMVINFDDGLGWQPFSIGLTPQYFNIIYPTNGVYLVQVAVVNDGDTIKHAESRINVLRNTVSRSPDYLYTFSGGGGSATVSIYYGCGHSRLERPFVYLKGIDFFNQEHAEEIYTDVIDAGNLEMLRDFNYDFVIVDWANSTASLESNAGFVVDLLQSLIYSADSTGPDSNTQFVLMGESMGGVIGRLALNFMESPGYVNGIPPYYPPHPHSHNTRLFINLDGPQQGANVPLGLQRIYGVLADATIPLGNDVASLVTLGLASNAFQSLLATPAVRELLIYNDYDRTGSGKYPEDAMRATLLSELNAGGYPRHCKTLTITNGLLDSPSRQVTFSNNILRTGIPFFNFNLNCSPNLLSPLLVIPKLTISNLEPFTNPGFDSSGIILQGSITTYPFSFYGCLLEILSLGFSHTSCFTASTTSISQGADSVQPLDIMPGGQYALIADNFNSSRSFIDLAGYFIDESTISPTYIHYYMGGVFAPLNLNLTLDNYIDHFCFIPRFSALDYHPLFPAIPADHDILTDPIDTIVNRIPFDVAVGWYSSGSPGMGGYATFNSPYGDNSYHLTVRDDYVPYDYGSLGNSSWLVREVGDDVMNLDNLKINRKAMFSARDSIIAGWSESPYYYYPNGLPNPLYPAMYSKQDSFVVDSLGGDVTFRAEHRIILDNGFKAKVGSRFHMILDSDIDCTIPESSLTSVFPNEGGNDTANKQLVTQQNIVINKTSSLKVYPNPSQRLFNVILPDSTTGQINVQVVDVYSKIIANFTLTNQNQFVIDAAKYNMAMGIYALIVQTNNKVFSVKLIIN